MRAVSRCWIASLLYSGPPPNSENLSLLINEIRPDIIINLREETETSHWYHKKIASMQEVLAEHAHDGWVPRYIADVYDEPHAVLAPLRLETCPISSADNTKGALVLCRRIMDAMRQNKRVLLLGGEPELMGTLAFACMWWYEKSEEKILVRLQAYRKEARDFATARTKGQRELLEFIADEAKKLQFWEKHDFLKIK